MRTEDNEQRAYLPGNEPAPSQQPRRRVRGYARPIVFPDARQQPYSDA